MRTRFSATFQISTGSHPTSYAVVPGLFSRVKAADVAFRSSRARGNFLFAATDNLVVHQGTTVTGIQTVQFRNRHCCKKGRLWLPFGVTKYEAKQLCTFTYQDPVRILNGQLSARYDIPLAAVTVFSIAPAV